MEGMDPPRRAGAKQKNWARKERARRNKDPGGPSPPKPPMRGDAPAAAVPPGAGVAARPRSPSTPGRTPGLRREVSAKGVDGVRKGSGSDRLRQDDAGELGRPEESAKSGRWQKRKWPREARPQTRVKQLCSVESGIASSAAAAGFTEAGCTGGQELALSECLLSAGFEFFMLLGSRAYQRRGTIS